MVFVSVPAAQAAGLKSSESSLLRAMNEARAAHGLAPLRIEGSLETAARAHSHDMLLHGYFAHGPFFVRLRSFGVHGRTVGENLAWGVGRFATARSVVQRWLASPEHRANLLRPGFRRVGIAAPLGRFVGYARARVVTADFAGW